MDRPPAEIALPVAEAVSEASGTPIEELPPLAESVDLDGLNAVTDDSSHDVTVTFSHAGLRVLVHSGRIVYARPVSADGPDPPDGLSPTE